MGNIVRMRPPKEKSKNPKRKKVATQSICLYADFGCTTGFGNLAKELVERWAKKFRKTHIVIFAVNHPHGIALDIAPNVAVIPAQLRALPDNTDAYYRFAFLEFIAAHDFTSVVIINDLEVINPMKESFNIVFDQKRIGQHPVPKMTLYFPVDSPPAAADTQVLELFDDIITYTEYARTEITKVNPEQGQRLEVIPHGVDTDAFYQLPASHAALNKEGMFGTDVYVFGTVNRNSARKDIATLVMAFDLTLKRSQTFGLTRPVLYLHCNPVDPYGVNLIKLCERLGLELGRDVYFPENFSESVGFAVSELNKIYNTFDCFVTTTTAEGWGLTVTEAMACKVPVIAPDHTSLSEITASGRAFHTGEMDDVVFVNDGDKVRRKSKVRFVSDAMTDLLQNDNCASQVKKAHAFIKTLTWDAAADRFFDIISKHLNREL